jgi:phosphonate metabolism-associated iron-containing alcohol dehydrogenase
MMWKYHNPVNIIFTEYFIEELIKLIDSKQKILLICSKRFTTTNEFELIQSNISGLNIYTEIENDPSFDSCNKAIEFAGALKPETIIAIGGGSVIDTAKAVRLSLMTDSSNIQYMLENKSNCKKNIKFLAIPTTHGTASELTMWATIWDKKEKKKYSLSHEKNYPDYTIYDYHFVKDLPLDISLITTLDALSHSFEALWNKNANPISDDYAIKAITSILKNIGRLTNKTDIQTRTNLLQATMFSGLAFSNTKTAAAHSISYPLTALHGIPHGIACSMTLYRLLKINSKVISKKINRLLSYTKNSSIDELWVKLKKSINGKIKFSLQEYGINPDDITQLLEESFTKGRMDNNIVKLNREDVKNILIEVGGF